MTGINAYMQVADADEWIQSNVTFHSAWDDNDALQAAALIEASDHIDSLRLKGTRYADKSLQAREFPRIPDRAARAIPLYSETLFQTLPDYSEVPQEVLDACCLEALEILKQGDSLRRENQEQDVKSQTIAGATEQYGPGAGRHKLWSIRARDKLKDWIAGAVEAA